MIQSLLNKWINEKAGIVETKVAGGEAQATLIAANLIFAVIIFILFNIGLVTLLFVDDADFGKGCLIFSLSYALMLLIALSFRRKIVKAVKGIYVNLLKPAKPATK